MLALSWYIFAALASLIFLYLVLGLSAAQINVPFSYTGDSLQMGAWFKGVIDNGWYLENPLLGLPSGQVMYDFPMSNNMDFWLVKLLSLFSNDYATVINLFFIITFPLTAICTLFLFRQFKIAYPFAFVASLLYAFVPYHLLRGENHILYITYFTIPLILVVILWLYQGKPILIKRDNNGKLKLNLKDPRSIYAILACLLISSTVVYHVFFSCFLLAVAGILSSITKKEKLPLIICAILLCIIITGTLVNILPNIIYYAHNGSFSSPRNSGEAEYYGLKIIQMLLPVTGHRIAFLAGITARYNTYAPLVNENSMAALGMAGSLGFLILVANIFTHKSGYFKKSEEELKSLLDGLSFLNLSSVLLATIGGFGAVVALFLPEIRAYNRMSIVIALFSLFSLAIIGQVIYTRYFASGIKRAMFFVVLLLILLAGVYDQATVYSIPNYPANSAEYANDQHFVDNIETVMQPGATIFQLPFVPYPENPPVFEMTDYDLYRGYLHSDDLRWSYGAVKGRDSDTFQRLVSGMEVNDMLNNLSFAGFDGIYIDTYGYSDRGISLINNLTLYLNETPLVSDNSRLVFFDIRPYSMALRGNYTSEGWAAEADAVLHPVTTTWGGGFSGLESSGEGNWRWCSNEGLLTFNNMGGQSRNLTIDTWVQTGYPAYSKLIVTGPGFEDTINVNSTGSHYSREIELTQGKTTIRFSSDAARVNAPGDPRYLVFRLVNCTVEM